MDLQCGLLKNILDTKITVSYARQQQTADISQ